MTIRYRLYPHFVLRMTGFPVEELLALSDPALASAVDAQNAEDAAAEARRLALLEELRARGRETRKLREAVERRKPLPAAPPDELATQATRYHDDLTAIARRAEEAAARFAASLDGGRRHLYATVREERFRHVLLMSSPAFEAQLERDVSAERARNSSIRQLEATLVAYLQRVTTKNETISFYGPTVWGTVDPALPGAVDIALDDRELDDAATFFERWVCVALADRIAADPEVAPFLRPMRKADVELTVAGARRGNDELALSGEERAALGRLDGIVRAEALPAAALASLVDKGLVTAGLPLPFTLQPFGRLRDEVAGWPEGAPRARWLQILDELEGARAALETRDLAAQREALRALFGKISALGLHAQKEQQTIYAARLPVNSDCRRAANRVALGAAFVEQATADLAPWYELWRDLAGLYATRLHAKLRAVYEREGGRPLPLARFFRACDAARLPLLKTEGSGILPEVEAELQRAWAAQLGDRADLPELTLTGDDLAFVRRNFSFRRMKSYDHPSPDFQLAASEEELREGRWTLLLAETHPDLGMWQNCFSMWCPDPEALRDDYLAAGYDRLIEYRQGFEHNVVHTASLLFAGLHPRATAIAVVPPAHYQTVHPADARVEVTDDDVLVRGPDGAELGSLLHRWETAHNTHQLQLLGDRLHAPRLKVGRVVVQREHWVVEPDDALRAAVEEPGPVAFAALRALRARHRLPEEVFVHPVLPMKNSGHKEGKPTYVDFQSPLLVEGLATRVRSFRRLLVTEALPSTRQCWLRDHRGHYSCEIRCSARPVGA